MLGVVENMSGLRQRADALRFFLPGAPTPAAAAPAAGGAAGAVQNGGGAAASAPAEERDVTDQVLAALRQVAPHLEVSPGILYFGFACFSPQRLEKFNWLHTRLAQVVACESHAPPNNATCRMLTRDLCLVVIGSCHQPTRTQGFWRSGVQRPVTMLLEVLSGRHHHQHRAELKECQHFHSPAGRKTSPLSIWALRVATSPSLQKAE